MALQNIEGPVSLPLRAVVPPMEHNGPRHQSVAESGGRCDVSFTDAGDGTPLEKVPYLVDHDTLLQEDLIEYCQQKSTLENLIVKNVLDCNVYTLAAATQSSPLKPDMFEHWLKNYDVFEKAQVLFNLRQGVVIPSTLPSPMSYSFYNHVSALQHAEQVQELIDSRIQQGIIAGPYKDPPPGIILSPLAAIPKKEANVIRLIHNLSYPYGNSVNSHTDREFCTVEYETLDTCLEIIHRLGQGTKVAKVDIENAYNTILMHPNSFKFLGFSWNSLFYFGLTLPMGASISLNNLSDFRWRCNGSFGTS